MRLRRHVTSDLPGDLTKPEIDRLARYNGEVARGLVHTPGWREQMATLQQRYNDSWQLKEST